MVRSLRSYDLIRKFAMRASNVLRLNLKPLESISASFIFTVPLPLRSAGVSAKVPANVDCSLYICISFWIVATTIESLYGSQNWFTESARTAGYSTSPICSVMVKFFAIVRNESGRKRYEVEWEVEFRKRSVPSPLSPFSLRSIFEMKVPLPPYTGRPPGSVDFSKPSE